MNIKYLEFNTLEQKDLVSLRERILRLPLGLKFTPEELALEELQDHFGIFEEDKLIGGLILVKQHDKRIKMRQVCIDNSFQGKAYGQALVSYSEKWAKKQGFETMYCHARENALAFYQKMDYEISGNQFIEVGLAHYKLIKHLN